MCARLAFTPTPAGAIDDAQRGTRGEARLLPAVLRADPHRPRLVGLVAPLPAEIAPAAPALPDIDIQPGTELVAVGRVQVARGKTLVEHDLVAQGVMPPVDGGIGSH